VSSTVTQVHTITVREGDALVDRRVRVEVDMQQIAHELGRKAWRNKGRKAMDCGGYVRVYAVS
jgi:hypothetical protein